MNFKEELQNKQAAVNAMMERALTFIPDVNRDVIFEAMRYSAIDAGKRIRPVLAMAAAEALSGDGEKALPFGCSLEMIHCYSLIHDDLPAMDNDDLRRGKPTNHKVYGEGMAVLAGDALLTHAFSWLFSQPAPPEQLVAIGKILSDAAGVDGMLGGQVIDIAFEGKPVEEATLYDLHRRKTGALLLAAVQIGAVVAGKPDALNIYGKNIGLAFQVQDDILDVIGDEALLGKPIGSDAKNQKTTFVTLYGLDGAKELLHSITEKAVDSLSPFGEKAAFLRELALYLENRVL
ncbi:MAG: polyprenyl synthetase family protein [Clostridia bacterium]|nr:polyprenyl synthetase family protein [Clostridia bacterium]